MDKKMNGGKILKSWSIRIFVSGFVLSLMIGFISGGGISARAAILTMIISAVQSMLVWGTVSLFLYGFGELIDKICSMDNHMKIIAKHVENEDKAAAFEKEKRELLDALRNNVNS